MCEEPGDLSTCPSCWVVMGPAPQENTPSFRGVLGPVAVHSCACSALQPGSAPTRPEPQRCPARSAAAQVTVGSLGSCVSCVHTASCCLAWPPQGAPGLRFLLVPVAEEKTLEEQ